MKLNAITVILWALSLAAGVAAEQRDVPPESVTRSVAVLGPDDSITVLALNCEELSKDWRIGATGDVTFPMIGRLHLAGMTIEQAESEISIRLKKYLRDPQVTVYPSELRSRPITVAGAVDKPGKYQITATSTTLFDALVMAGGPKNAGVKVTVKRSEKEGGIAGPEVKTDKDGAFDMAEFDLKSILDGPDGPGAKANFKLQPFDVITVAPAAAPRYVHVVGEVNHPGSVELVTQDTVSLMKLIAVAGGLNNVAGASNTLIMHISPEGVQTSTAIVNLKMIMAGKSKDLDLIAGDIVMVPSSKAKVISQMFAGTAMNAGLTTAIYTLAKF
jgi:polysaccharide export outer membrane protein